MKFGLIGTPLGHSFSKVFFTKKFEALGLLDFTYDLFELHQIEEVKELLRSDVFGLNVTIPYKQAIISYLNEIDPVALQIGAVNTLVRSGPYSWKGYNTDFSGFKSSLMQWIGKEALPEKALILGSGGSSRAVCFALMSLGVRPSIVSRSGKGDYVYEDITADIIQEHLLIMNTTPLGMQPHIESAPLIPYEALSPKHWLFDLVYNPSNTLFLSRGQQMGARTKNGLDMLHRQADDAWEIWKNYGKF